MKHTLGTAAKATGKAKSTILRAIKSGTLSANKSPDGSYSIEVSELHRVFPPTGSAQPQSNDTQPHEEHPATVRQRLEILETERQRERDQLQATIDDLRARLDRAEGRADRADERIAALLTGPGGAGGGIWRRIFGKLGS